jgi:hypothetical protein
MRPEDRTATARGGSREIPRFPAYLGFMTKTCAIVALFLATTTVSAQPRGTILTSSDVFSDHLIERPVVLEGRTWLALMPPGSRLDAVRPRWNATTSFEDSVFTLAFDPPIDPSSLPLLMLADVPGVVAGVATTVMEYEQSLEAGAPSEISLGPRAYRLELRSADPMRCDATVTLSDGRTAQTLYVPDGQPFDCDEPHFSVQWAGDLDGDGRLDLVTTFSPKYSWYPRRLYLSSAAASGEVVGLVALLDLAAA